MAPMPRSTPEPLTPRLVDSLYTEAMLLADEARSYFEEAGRSDRAALDPLTRVSFSCESLKITTRLMHIVAWLLTRRAIEAGEIDRSEAPGARRTARRLGQAAETDSGTAERFPPATRSLIAASRDLYARVKRLEEAGSVDVSPSPARTLMGRLERSL